MRWIFKYSFICLIVIIFSSCSISPVDEATLSANKPYADFSGMTLQLNQPAPAFTLLSGSGEMLSLSDYKDKQAVLLLFYRGEWCAYCMDQLDTYQALLPELEKYQIQLLAISPDGKSAIEHTSRRFGQSYIFLSDEGLAVAKRYNVGNAKGLPHPSLFLIDRQGKLVWYYASTNHKVRPTARQVEAIIRQKFAASPTL
ncbi:Alkyl hydroperoxide reductase subunit C-like protein [hydrothermal vent metagenome]|uniref:thioredoxin-dependent peroxiredoxin n=1 Tax=hydrothermal vent metagenome TaxID=652676 RepID=A0A3B0YAP1_9ZZZZ